MGQENPHPHQIDGSPSVPGQESIVHLPALLADNFGVSRSEARMHVAMGTVEIDGKLVEGDRFDFERSDIDGKEIVVKSELRAYKLRYEG